MTHLYSVNPNISPAASLIPGGSQNGCLGVNFSKNLISVKNSVSEPGVTQYLSVRQKLKDIIDRFLCFIKIKARNNSDVRDIAPSETVSEENELKFEVKQYTKSILKDKFHEITPGKIIGDLINDGKVINDNDIEPESAACDYRRIIRDYLIGDARGNVFSSDNIIINDGKIIFKTPVKIPYENIKIRSLPIDYRSATVCEFRGEQAEGILSGMKFNSLQDLCEQLNNTDYGKNNHDFFAEMLAMRFNECPDLYKPVKAKCNDQLNKLIRVLDFPDGSRFFHAEPKRFDIKEKNISDINYHKYYNGKEIAVDVINYLVGNVKNKEGYLTLSLNEIINIRECILQGKPFHLNMSKLTSEDIRIIRLITSADITVLMENEPDTVKSINTIDSLSTIMGMLWATECHSDPDKTLDQDAQGKFQREVLKQLLWDIQSSSDNEKVFNRLNSEFGHRFRGIAEFAFLRAGEKDAGNELISKTKRYCTILEDMIATSSWNVHKYECDIQDVLRIDCEEELTPEEQRGLSQAGISHDILRG